MSWLKIDDAIGEHRKTRRLLRAGGLEAFGLHTLALVHCSRYLTDGFVETEFVFETLDEAGLKGKRRSLIVESLVAVGQWTPVDGGWTIHDYLEHNPTSDQVREQRGVDRFRKELTRDHALIAAIRARDGDACRYCSVDVNWKDRRSSIGGTYDHVLPVSKGGENTFENVVVCCRGCNQKKGPRTPGEAGMILRASGPGPETSSPSGQVDQPRRPGSRPVPSHPHSKTTPLAPRRGDDTPAPRRPEGSRQRDLDAWERQMTAWAAQHFPAADPARVIAAASWACPTGGAITAEALRQHASTSEVWAAELALDTRNAA